MQQTSLKVVRYLGFHHLSTPTKSYFWGAINSVSGDCAFSGRRIQADTRQRTVTQTLHFNGITLVQPELLARSCAQERPESGPQLT
jgi:hypothetical protein